MRKDQMQRASMFAALRVRNYRLWAGGQLVSQVGTWMQRLAQDWLILSLSGGDALALGAVVALQFGPTLGLSLWGGVIADRYDKRLVVMATQTGSGMCALLLGLVDVLGHTRLWQVYVLALLLGCFSAVDTPVRQSFVAEMVGADRLRNAVALNSMLFNVAAVVGPALAGILIGVIGTGWVFLINVSTFGAVLAGLAAMDASALHRCERAARTPGQVREGLGYVWSARDVRVLLIVVFLTALSWLNFPMLLATMTRNVFGGGADAYGLLSTFFGIGTLAGAAIAARGTAAATLRSVFGPVVPFGLLEMVIGLMPNRVAVAVALIPAGVVALVFTTAAMSYVQLSVPATFRGRVMGIYTLCFLGATPLGAPLLGWLANGFGGRAPFLVGGGVTVAGALLCGTYLLRRERASLRLTRRDGSRFPILELRRADETAG